MYDEVAGIAVNMAIASQIEDETVLDRMVEFYYQLVKDKEMTFEAFRTSVMDMFRKYPACTEGELDILVAESGEGLNYVLPKLTEPQQREYLGLVYDALVGVDEKFGIETPITKEAFILGQMNLTKDQKEAEDDEIGEALSVIQEAIVKRGLSKDYYDKVVEAGAALFNKPLDSTKDYFDEVYKAIAA